MKNKNGWLLPTFLLLLIVACTPKTTEKATTTEPTTTQPAPPPPEEALSPCPKFTEAPNPDEAETNYVLYRDFLRAGDFTQAYQFWQKVYEVAPAADGRRNTVLSDGIYFYERLYGGEEDSLAREHYIDLIFELYDQIDRCYPEGGYVDGRKAFDLFYKYPHRASKEEIYALFKESIDTDGIDAQYFVLNPFTSLLVDLYFEGTVTLSEARKYQELVRQVLAKGLAECKGNECEHWRIIEQYAPVRLEAFETVKGFYDCSYYEEKYFPDFVENPTDCDIIRTAYSRFKWGDCPEADEKFKQIIAAGNEHCVETGPLELAYDALREANYPEAINLFKKAAEEETNSSKKANILLLVAKVYYSHLKNYPQARQYAREAASYRPGWGEPYMLIGRLYASSGPLCGPGRGWDSQIVTWPAIDMWNKAKSIDSSVASEARKLIARYEKFMPTIEDIFQRNRQEGESFYVGCWIQESTIIRAAPRQ